jgi:aerobic carbon-monoxide dehydrogenase medium subunit
MHSPPGDCPAPGRYGRIAEYGGDGGGSAALLGNIPLRPRLSRAAEHKDTAVQVPAPFAYERATGVEHALSLLARHDGEARVIAGGHSLIPMMKLRLAEPETLIDINGISELAAISHDGDHVAIGALARHADLLASPLIAEHFPILRDAEQVIADPLVRNMGTVGGSLCQADPSEDLSAAFVALGAEAVIQGPEGTRTVALREFHLGAYETVVQPTELLVQVRVPVRADASSAYAKVERRAGDWAVAAAGAVLRCEAGGTIAEAGLGLAAVGAPHLGAPQAEEFLRGRRADDETFAEAGRLAAAHCEPQADQRGPADYKRHLAGVLTTRALQRAHRRISPQED